MTRAVRPTRGGASFRLGRLDLMLGLGYATGKSPFPSLFGDDPSPDPDLDTFLRLSQWTLVIGAELLSADDGGGGS